MDFSHQSLVDQLLHTPLSLLATTIIEGEEPIPSSGSKPDIELHIIMLKDEFIGQNEILLYHALLNVFLRRGINISDTTMRFRKLWTDYRSLLLSKLDSRWLVSACDSIVDHFDEPNEKITAMSASLLINTIKLYETERLALGQSGNGRDLANPTFHWEGRVNLFDGISAFRIGKGDMVKNMLTRISSIEQHSEFAAPIMKELIYRVNTVDTVFKRLRSVHTKRGTLWHI
ncbi:MAG: hypothetical protein ACK5GZ_13795 [Cyanobium sp.]|jgi:hypothetical protein